MDLKTDNNILIFCVIGIFVGIILVVLNAYMGQPPLINTILSFIGISMLIFAGAYILLSLIFGLLGLFFKKLKENYVVKIKTKLILSIITLIIVIILILSSIPCLGCNGSTPTQATKSVLKTQMNNPGAESCTESVTFSRSNSQLSAEGITRDTGLSPEQVVFANPKEISGFEASNSLLKYTNPSNKKVIMCIVCSDNGKTGLELALIANEVSTTINSTKEEQTLCVVYPKNY